MLLLLSFVFLNLFGISYADLDFKNTSDCSASPVPFNINNFLFALPANAPASLMTAERLRDPARHYGNVQEHITLLNFFIDESKKFNTESKDSYYSTYVVHYPIMVAKFYCSLVGRDRPISNFDNIDAKTFYIYLTSHQADWDWLNPSIVKEPAVWDTNSKEIVISTVLSDSQSRGVITAGWNSLYMYFADLLYQMTQDFQSGDTSSTRTMRFPVSILPASFLKFRFNEPLNKSTVILSKNDIINLNKMSSPSVSARINSYINKNYLKTSKPKISPRSTGFSIDLGNYPIM